MARIQSLVRTLVFLAVLLAPLASAEPAEASSYVVNTTDSTWDGHCDSHCSLWDAQQAAYLHPGPDRITFALPGDGPHVIMLATPEGRTVDPVAIGGDGTSIDATMQPGWPVYLHGMGLAGWGMIVAADDCTVNGLGFLGFTEAGLLVSGERNFVFQVVAGDFMEEGFVAAPLGNHVGIELAGAENAVRQSLVTNNDVGILAHGLRQHVYGSHIGFQSGGASRRGNEDGIQLQAGSDGSIIETNAFVGNTRNALTIYSSGNVIRRNSIGRDPSTVHGNRAGIVLNPSGGNNQIGGAEPFEGNVIVDNDVGIDVLSSGNVIFNNRIGVDFAGTAIPNGQGVVLLVDTEDTILGHADPALGNIIAHNTGAGVAAYYASGALVQGNTIHSNGGDGVLLDGAEDWLPTRQVELQQNSIYDNGGLGIRFSTPDQNGGIRPPELSGFADGVLTGSAAPNARIEIFLAERDPSGSGEGKTFVGQTTSDEAGLFEATVTGTASCDLLTVTATDEGNHTSVFSNNQPAGICVRIPPLVAVVILLLGGGVGAAAAVIIRRRPPDLRSVPGILLGALVGLGLGLLLLRLPFLQLSGGGVQQVSTPVPGGSNLPAPATLTPITITLTPALAPEIMARENANCREGPSTQFDVAAHLLQGQVVPLTGRLAEGGWWQVQVPDLEAPCWIAESIAEPNGDLDAVPVVVAPAPPTVPPIDEPEQPQGCWCRNNPSQACLFAAPCPANPILCQPG